MRGTLVALGLLISGTSFAYLSHHTAHFEGHGSYRMYGRKGLERSYHHGRYQIHASVSHNADHSITVTNTYRMKDKTHSFVMTATPQKHHPHQQKGHHHHKYYQVSVNGHNVGSAKCSRMHDFVGGGKCSVSLSWENGKAKYHIHKKGHHIFRHGKKHVKSANGHHHIRWREYLHQVDHGKPHQQKPRPEEADATTTPLTWLLD